MRRKVALVLGVCMGLIGCFVLRKVYTHELWQNNSIISLEELNKSTDENLRVELFNAKVLNEEAPQG